MRTFTSLLAVCMIVLVATAVAEQSRPPVPAAPPGSTPVPTPAVPKISMDGPQYQMVGTIKDLMEHMIDPAADILWDAVATDITAAGIIDKRPQTDEEWLAIENAALILTEAPNLLKMPGRKVAAAGESTQSEGPDAPELTADQIAAKIARNRKQFIRYANGLQNTARKALEATRKRDADALFELGEEIDTTCENCHLEYWYPNERKPVQAPSQRN